jgi:hypothetical protein
MWGKPNNKSKLHIEFILALQKQQKRALKSHFQAINSISLKNNML